MTADPQFLFVYGTLMSTAASALGTGERVRLASVARNLGPATVHGRLYDLGGYPGLVDAPGALVEGEVVRLAAGEFRWLDRYEGVGADEAEYERGLRPARLAGGTLVSAWVYLYRGPTAGLMPIESGRWRDAEAS